ncbi:FAD:protein FMN transferase [Spongiibacter sp. KMU-158]|uniref:FAD:protein FMN transferase n=1 Tax=Spongiibacter pelagi TaxID=2760804 RepID=A0A927C2S5_9GAMM|nr:FAD:protein FMN transferase [Spongiibacter pelagi]MBD2859103.1 FAD:protein FMN transferase [Spongiibacter pelagi]
MGTTYHITLLNPGDLSGGQLKAELDERLLAFNQIASTYIEDSELNQLNHAPVGEWITLSETLYDIISVSVQVSWMTHGAFDITVAPLVSLWGFGPEKRQGVPADEDIEAAKQLVGTDTFELDILEPKIRRLLPIRMDLSAVAKGYAVDMTADWLADKGATDFLVEIGGEIRVAGDSPRGDPWRIAVENPSINGAARAIRLENTGVATSGDYRNYFEENGVRYSHTIDPKTGRPITHNLASVTVLDPSSAMADAMATAFSVLGGERTLKLAEAQDIPVYLIEKTPQGFVSRYSSTFAPFLEEM